MNQPCTCLLCEMFEQWIAAAERISFKLFRGICNSFLRLCPPCGILILSIPGFCSISLLQKPDLKRTAVCNRPIFGRCHENEASVYGVRQGIFRPLRFTVQKKEKKEESIMGEKMTLSVPIWIRRIFLPIS